MLGYIFRTYDIRGIVGSELILEEVYNLARAIAAYFIQHQPMTRAVVIGMDGRAHSLYIKDEVVRAFLDSGLNVVFVGACPTPVVYFALHTALVDAGLMITASHNGPSYNGIKICLGKESVWGSQIQVIRALYEQRIQKTTGMLGEYRYEPIKNQYLDWLVHHFSHIRNLSIPIVFDCANGATGTVIPDLVERLSFKNVSILYEHLDGSFPHHEADPTIDENMHDLRAMMSVMDAEIGIGFDGDGDRMAPVTRSGKLLSGDKLLILLSQPIIEQQPGGSIVFDIKCSSLVAEKIKEWGGCSYIVPSGHSIIKHAMRKYGAVFGGELSCHFFFADRYFGYDDGIYAALRLIELLATSTITLESFVETLPMLYATPELRIACPEGVKQQVVEEAKRAFLLRHDAELLMIDGVRAMFPYGWGLLRASNTEAHISVRCESETMQGLIKIKRDFYHLLAPYIEKKILDSLLGE